MRNHFPDEDFDLWILFNEVKFLLFSPRDMEESSLIKKERDEKNHKLVKVYITETGERIFEELSHSQVVSDVFKVLDSSDREQLRSLLEKIRKQIISSILTKRERSKQSDVSTPSLTA